MAYLYAGKCLKKGNRVIRVVKYFAPDSNSHITPSGTRRGKYGCIENGELFFRMTHNISRMVRSENWIPGPDDESITLPYELPCWLHTQYGEREQENVTEKHKGLWKRFWNLLIFNKD